MAVDIAVAFLAAFELKYVIGRHSGLVISMVISQQGVIFQGTAFCVEFLQCACVLRVLRFSPAVQRHAVNLFGDT